MNIDKATRSELEVIALENDDLFLALGQEDGILNMTTEQLRAKITDWVIKENETE